jgi:hypothetical protein
LFNRIIRSNKNKLLKLLLISIFLFSMVLPALANGGTGTGTGGGAGAGTNPLTFKGAYLTTTNHLTESDPLKQTSNSGVRLDDNNSVPSGSQSIDIWIDKNIITDTHFEHNKGCITLKDLTTSSKVSISFFRLGATDGSGVYKQHIYFDTNLVGGHSYEITIDGSLTANNGLTLLTTKHVNFKVAGAPSPVNSAPNPTTKVGTSTSTPNTDNGSNAKTTSPNTVNPSIAPDPTKPSVSTKTQAQSKGSVTKTPDISFYSRLKSKLENDGQTAPASVAQSSNETKKGRISATTWITIIGAVLLAAWIALKIIARKRK